MNCVVIVEWVVVVVSCVVVSRMEILSSSLSWMSKTGESSRGSFVSSLYTPDRLVDWSAWCGHLICNQCWWVQVAWFGVSVHIFSQSFCCPAVSRLIRFFSHVTLYQRWRTWKNQLLCPLCVQLISMRYTRDQFCPQGETLRQSCCPVVIINLSHVQLG